MAEMQPAVVKVSIDWQNDIMSPTELAHWRYRIKALQADLPKWEQWTREAGSDARRWPEEPFISLHEETKETLAFIRYLLEEAKYMAELGNIAVPPVPRPEAGTTGTTEGNT